MLRALLAGLGKTNARAPTVTGLVWPGISLKVFLKDKVNWNTVCGAIQDLPWRNIWLADNPVEVLNKPLFLLVGCYVPTKVIRVCNKDKPWFDDQCRQAFGLKQEAHLRWTRDRSWVNWEEYVRCQVRANEPTQRPSVSLVTETGLFL